MPSEPRILHGDDVVRALGRGARTMSSLLAPTLGPVARTVAISGATPTTAPEILDSGATIARRTVQIDDPFADMGAMIVRQLAWTMHETVGDGSVTAVVLAHALVAGGQTYLAAGGNPLTLQRTWQRALPAVIDAVQQQAVTIESRTEIAGLVRGLLYEPELAAMISEVMDSLGVDGAVTIEPSRTGESGHEYVDGISWKQGWVSPHLLPAGQTRIELESPAIAISATPLLTVDEMVPVVEACLSIGRKHLLVIAPEIRDAALALLTLNRDRGVLDGVAAVKAPLVGQQQAEALLDIAALLGGQCNEPIPGVAARPIRSDDLGFARRVWVERNQIGILGGEGDRPAIRQRVKDAKTQLRAAQGDDALTDTIRSRIGRLIGAAAVVRVGAATETARKERIERVERAVAVVRDALRDGVVPGGGVALVRAVDHLDCAGPERLGERLLAEALTAPMRSVVANAGLEVGCIIDDARQQPASRTYDVRQEQWVDALAAGITVPVPSMVEAIQASVSAASMILTTGTLIRRRNPELAQTP